MTASTKRAWKLQEFPAHGAKVNCAAIGQTTGRIMVTGGDDRKVNVWSIGKPNVIMTLTGHTSAVETVRLDTSEEKVITGSRSGTLKIWDLEQRKIIRTLTGHKANIRCLDIHPYGDFVVSGSADTFVKVWDVRRKGCIFTYKGHTDCVNCLRVSPDGRWVVSCSDDGTIRLWDLTAGKQYHCFKDFEGPVEWLEFHPTEFLLTGCGADRTVKFWDLETLQFIASTEPESSSIRCIKFHPDGSPLFSGGQDSLRVYGWEPTCCFDAIPIPWGKVVDMSVVNNQLVAASLYQTLVSVWVADLMRLKPFSSSSSADNASDDNAVHRVLSGRKSFVRDMPASPPRSPSQKDVTTENNENAAPVTGDDKEEIFKSRQTLMKTPTKNFDPFPAPPEDTPDPPVSVMIRKQPPARPKTTSTSSKSARAAADASEPRQEEETKATVVPHDREKAAGLDAEEFLQRNRMQKPSTVGITSDEAVKKLEPGHHAMSLVLSSRATRLGLVRAAWSTDNVKNAVCVALDQDDDSVIIDLLGILCLKHSLWNLEICNLLLPKLQQLLSAKYGSYILMACKAVKMILRNFAPVIKSNLAAPPGPGIDINREERYMKCKTCNSLLQEVRRTAVERQSQLTGKLGSAVRELKVAFLVFDS